MFRCYRIRRFIYSIYSIYWNVPSGFQMKELCFENFLRIFWFVMRKSCALVESGFVSFQIRGKREEGRVEYLPISMASFEGFTSIEGIVHFLSWPTLRKMGEVGRNWCVWVVIIPSSERIIQAWSWLAWRWWKRWVEHGVLEWLLAHQRWERWGENGVFEWLLAPTNTTSIPRRHRSRKMMGLESTRGLILRIYV